MLRSGSIRPDRPDLFAIFRRCRHFGRRVDRPRSIPPYLCACCPARYPRSRSPDLARRPQAQTLSPAPAQLRTPFPEPQSRPPGPQPPDGADTLFGPRNEHHPKTQTQHRPATSGHRRHPIRPPKRTPPENTDAAPSRNLRTPPAPIRPPRNEHCPKTQTQHRPVAPERRLSPIRPPKRTPPENTEAAPSRNLRTPPAPIRPPPKRTPSENTDAAPSRNLRTPPAPIRLPKRTPPENTEAAPIRSPLQKNAIIPAGTSSGRDDPHSERRRTASRDDGMSAVGPPSGETALLPRQPSAPLRIPPSQAGRPLRLQKRSH